MPRQSRELIAKRVAYVLEHGREKLRERNVLIRTVTSVLTTHGFAKGKGYVSHKCDRHLGNAIGWTIAEDCCRDDNHRAMCFLLALHLLKNFEEIE